MTRSLIGSTLLCVSFASAQAPPPSSLTVAQVKQAAAEAAIRKNPKNIDSYNELALAFVQRAQDTSDMNYYAQAQEAVNTSLRLAPDNFGAEKLQVRILLGRSDYTAALELARRLNKRVPDDVPVYDFVADADIQLGDYKEAEDRAQWALNLRPASATSLLPAAELRELFGDDDGALAFLHEALQMTSLQEAQARAHILVEIARLSLANGKLVATEKALSQALIFMPGYHPALTLMARLRCAQHKYDEAVELWRRECQAVPSLQNYYGLADALEEAGHKEEATAAYAEFQGKALNRISNPDNDNLDLIFYYAEQARKPAEALRIARLDLAQKHDALTLDAYAWALYANGEYSEARKQMDAALAVGIKDAEMFYHAGAIRSELHEPAAAADYWQQALEVNPHDEDARKALAKASSVAQAPTR